MKTGEIRVSLRMKAMAVLSVLFLVVGSLPTMVKAQAMPVRQANTLVGTATMLVVDVSGSMGDTWQGGVKIESAKSAANQIINMLEQESQATQVIHRVGVVTFTTSAYLNLSLTSDFNQARNIISGLAPLESTNIGDGLYAANQGLAAADSGEDKLIILLSDGMTNVGLSPDEIISGPVQDAANAGTCIYTVGFGDPGDLDEDLLRRIATGSGCGQYYYATDVDELEQVYIRIRHRSQGTILGDFTGNVNQGQTVTAGNVDVPVNQDQLNVTLRWPDSKLEVRAIDPQGKVVAQGDPNVDIRAYQNLIYLIVLYPMTGRWQFDVVGVDVPQGSMNYQLVVSSRTGTLPSLTPTPTLAITPTVTPLPPARRIPITPAGGSLSILVVVLFLGIGLMGVFVYAMQLRRRGHAPASGAGYPPPAGPYAGVPPSGAARLVIAAGSRAGQAIPLGSQPLSIGRGPANQLQLNDDVSASRVHAILRFAQGRWYLQDQGSTAGTYVNGQRVNAVALNNGDQIQIGTTIFVFRV